MTHSIRVVYAAIFYYVIRCLTRLYILFHSAVSHHSTFSSDTVPTHVVDISSVAMFCVSSLCISAAIPHSAVRVVPGEVGD